MIVVTIILKSSWFLYTHTHTHMCVCVRAFFQPQHKQQGKLWIHMYHRLSTRSNKQYRACPFKHDLLFVTLFQMLIDEHRKHKFAYICLWGLSSERLKVGFGQDSCTNSFKERVIHAASLLQRLNFSSVNMGNTYLLGWNLKGCDL